MAKIPIEELLKPLSADNPCGSSLDDDIELGNLWREIENESKGKPEQQFGNTIIEAKPADWKKIHSQCVTLLKSCRHLEPAIYLCAAAVESDGLPGLRDGLKLLVGLVTNYWAEVHPLPDPDDPEDYYEREGVFDLMSPAYQETPDDVLRFVERTRRAVLAENRQIGRVSHEDILAEKSKAEGAPSKEMIVAIFAQAEQEPFQQVLAANTEASELLDSLQSILDEKLGGNAPHLGNLKKELADISNAIKVCMSGGDDDAAQAADGPGQQQAPQGSIPGVPVAAGAPQHIAGAAVPGVVYSREDVVQVLNSVIAYYKSFEPASPVPLLLQRAKALVNDDFLGIIRNFRPDLERDFLAILGVSDASPDNAKIPTRPAPPPPRPSAPAPQQPASDPEPDPWASANF